MSIIANLYNSGRMSKYQKDGQYTSPQHEKIPAEEKKQPQYCLEIARGAFSALMRNKHSLPVGDYSKIQILRDYLHGKQNEQYYLNVLKQADPQTPGGVQADGQFAFSKEAQNKGYEHLSTKIVSSMPAIRQAIQGLFSDYDEYAFVTTIDEEAGNFEDNAVAESYADISLKSVTDAATKSGIPLTPDIKFPLDTTLDELLIYKEMGGFKAKWAEGIEQLIFFTQKQSDWDGLIKRKFIDDYLACSWIAAREVYDEEKNIVKMEYVDIDNFTIQYSSDRLFDDAEYAGYFTLEKISKLVRLGFDSDELKSAARKYSGLFDNSNYLDSWNDTPTDVIPNRIMDYRIPVFHYYWIDVDVKRTLKVKGKFAEKNFNIGLDEEIKPVSEYRAKNGVSQEEINTRIRRVYRCSWVVDTEMVYDFGLLPNQARKSKKEAQLPFFVYKDITTNPNVMFGSIVENVIPFLDRQQILWLKYQDALVKAHPGGYMINMRLLQNLEIKGKNIDPLAAFEMFWKYGRGVYMDTPIDGRYEGGAVLPISQIPGNYGQLLAVLSQEMEYIKGQIRDYTGIDPTTVGIASQGSTATEVSMAKQGTNNILRPMIKAIFTVKRDWANYAAKTIQLMIRNVDACYKAYSNIAGEDVTSILKEMERDGCEYGMTLDPKPSDDEMRSVIEAANAAMSQGRDGMSQIDLGQWMHIQERIMNGGNIKKLRRDIAFMIRKKEERDQQMILERTQVQAQEQAKIAQQVKQLEMEQETMKIQARMQEIEAEARAQMMIDKNKADVEFKYKIAELALESDTDVKTQKSI